MRKFTNIQFPAIRLSLSLASALKMKYVLRFLYRFKFATVNIVFGIVSFALPLLKWKEIDAQADFFFVLGVLLVAGLFLEFGAVHYKAAGVYSKEEHHEVKIPLIIQLTFFPRLIISFVFAALFFQALGWISKTDFVLVPILLFAFAYEFWIRSSLLNPSYGQTNTINRVRFFLSDSFHLMFLIVFYFCIWQLLLLDTEWLLGKMRYVQNYPLFCAFFLVAMLCLQLPYIVEEYFRPKGHGGRLAAILSFIAPLATFIYHMYWAGETYPKI